MICQKCKTDRFLLDDVTNGCIVCTECGLIAIEQLLSDEPYFDKDTEQMSHSITSKFQLSSKKFKNQSFVSFFSTQDSHTLKLMHFHKRFEYIFNCMKIHESLGADAKMLYLDFENHHSLKGHNLDYMICGFIYIACKKKSCPINIKDFGEEYSKYILKSINFIENTFKEVKLIEKPKETFHDKEIESFMMDTLSAFELKGVV